MSREEMVGNHHFHPFINCLGLKIPSTGCYKTRSRPCLVTVVGDHVFSLFDTGDEILPNYMGTTKGPI